ncbi:unnamed protein product, partial [Larinioides sclopetarius]
LFRHHFVCCVGRLAYVHQNLNFFTNQLLICLTRIHKKKNSWISFTRWKSEYSMQDENDGTLRCEGLSKSSGTNSAQH